jgi:hypothetical protein
MRQNQKINKGFLLLALCATVFSASAQKSFRYQAPLGRIDSTGFYSISLGPAIVSKSKDDLSDIRLADANGNFVPYVTQANLPQVEKQKFIPFPHIYPDLKTDSETVFIVTNSDKKLLSTLWVKLKNMAVSRLVNLSGSDDLKKWYAIEEDIPLQEAMLNNDGAYMQYFTFPASSYRYIKLLVKNKNRAPIQFLDAGVYTKMETPPVYLPVLTGTFTRENTDKASYITIPLNDNYIVNRVNLSVTGPMLYQRDVSVYRADKYGRHFICSAEISSNKQDDILFSTRAAKLELQIDNGDNTQLAIAGVKVYQEERYIISYLEKGKSYKLYTGDAQATLPEYDLKFFTDSIRNIKEAGLGTLIANSSYATTSTAKPDYTALIWVAIIIALLLLTLLTWKMVTEVNRKTGAA